MQRAASDRTKDFLRWEVRIRVALPLLFVLVALVTGSLGVELTAGALGRESLSQGQTIAVEKVRFRLIGLGSASALGLGFLVALAISRPLRRIVQTVRARIEVERVAARESQVNELSDLSNAFDDMLLSFDKFVTDSYILEAMPVAVLLVDERGRVKRSNAEARRLLHSPANGLEGREVGELASPDVGRALMRAVRGVRETGRSVELPAGEIEAAKLSVAVHHPPAGEPGELLVTIRDLSQVPMIRREIRRVDQLAAIGAHLASLAHEASGSFMAIQTLLDLVPVKEEAAGVKEKLQAEVERASRLMDEILAFGQVTLQERRPCNVVDLIEESIWLVQQRFADKKIQIVKQLPSDSPSVTGNRDRLTQAFLNILTNAFEATPAAGTIRLVAERAGAQVVVGIANTGSYISPQEQKKLFTPFYSTKPQGTGLGLPLARRTVIDHGGELEVRSSQDTGTEFVIRLPAR